MDDANPVTTKLLTLLNVSATKIDKRKLVDDFVHSETKLNKRARPSVTLDQVTLVKEKENRQEGEKKHINPANGGGDVEAEAIVDETEGTNFSFRTNYYVNDDGCL
jgi:U3 small nucleolar RNA-associated protein 25